jgi:hypothetical protein
MTTTANVIPLFARVKINGIEVHPGPPRCDAQRKISTSEKLDWLDAMMADDRLGSSDKIVAYCIRQHVNRDTGTAYLSDETIADKTRIGIRWVRMARNKLRAAGWITWTRKTRTSANIYSTLTGPMASIVERQQEFKKQREERRMQRYERQRSAELPQAADGNDDRQPSAVHDGQPSAVRDRQPSADIPLSTYPLDEPLKESIYTGSSVIEIKNAAKETDFEHFWQQYPRRVGKLKAEKIYNEIIKSKRAPAAELLAGARRYAAEREDQDEKYTKHASTWLTAGGWMDEPLRPSGLLAKQSGGDSAFAGILRVLEGRSHD